VKRVAKWIFLGWTALCLTGLTRSLMHTVPAYRASTENDERELAQIAVTIGAIEWVGIWIVIAVPSGISLLTANKSANTHRPL